MIHKKLIDIIIEDIQYLVDNNVVEQKTLEYKSQLPDNSDTAKKKFLAGISSLANTIGGDFIIGIKESKGILCKDIGIKIDDVDSEIARIENIIREGIAPRISIESRCVNADENKKVIILRVKASLEAPHRVIFKGHDKFYKRNSNGKYPMDVNELKAAFIQSSDLINRIRRFRTTRVSDIKAGETPYPIKNNSSFIAIHILPLSAFSSSFKIDSKTLLSLKEGKLSSCFVPLYAFGFNNRINLDGIVVYSSNEGQVARAYSQLYKQGIIEAVENGIILHPEESGKKILPMYSIERETMKCIDQTIELLSELEFQAPFFVFLSLIGVKDFTVSKPNRLLFLDTEPITKNDLLLPEVIIENTEEDIQQKMRPIFDMIWNAGGISRSLNFDDNNNFNNSP